MWPSTWASSVDSRLWKYRNRAVAAATKMTAASMRPRRTLGVANGFADGSCLGGSAGGTLTFAAFSSPTSISTLIMSSLRVSLFHLSDGTSKVRAGLIKAVKRGDLVVVRPGKRILGGDNFNIVGNPGLKAVACRVSFVLGKLNAQIGDLH